MTEKNETERAGPIKMQPGDDLHLTMLMAPHGLNFVTGKDREQLLAWGRGVWQAARRAPVVPDGWREALQAVCTDMVSIGNGQHAISSETRAKVEALQAELFAAAPQPPVEQSKCWCTTCRPLTLSDMRFVVCPDCGNKRCPKANNHENACTNSNAVGQPGSSWEHVPPRYKREVPELSVERKAMHTAMCTKPDANLRGLEQRWGGGTIVELPEKGEAYDFSGELAEVRDLFPAPERGSEMEGHWLPAMADPECALNYIKQQVRALLAAQKTDTGGTNAQ